MNLNIKYHQLFIVIALGVIIASLFYPIVTIVLAQQVEGYPHMRDLISELGVSTLPFSWVLTAVLIVDALLMFGLAFAVHGSIGQRDQKKLDTMTQAIILAMSFVKIGRFIGYYYQIA